MNTAPNIDKCAHDRSVDECPCDGGDRCDACGEILVMRDGALVCIAVGFTLGLWLGAASSLCW